jgi:hypothetical protein
MWFMCDRGQICTVSELPCFLSSACRVAVSRRELDFGHRRLAAPGPGPSPSDTGYRTRRRPWVRVVLALVVVGYLDDFTVQSWVMGAGDGSTTIARSRQGLPRTVISPRRSRFQKTQIARITITTRAKARIAIVRVFMCPPRTI